MSRPIQRVTPGLCRAGCTRLGVRVCTCAYANSIPSRVRRLRPVSSPLLSLSASLTMRRCECARRLDVASQPEKRKPRSRPPDPFPRQDHPISPPSESSRNRLQSSLRYLFLAETRKIPESHMISSASFRFHRESLHSVACSGNLRGFFRTKFARYGSPSELLRRLLARLVIVPGIIGCFNDP